MKVGERLQDYKSVRLLLKTLFECFFSAFATGCVASGYGAVGGGCMYPTFAESETVVKPAPLLVLFWMGTAARLVRFRSTFRPSGAIGTLCARGAMTGGATAGGEGFRG